jgi:hypothetical protein
MAAPDLGSVADNLLDEKTSENLPPIIGPIEPPSWWSQERLTEQYEEQRRIREQTKAFSPRQAARSIDRALASVKPAPTKLAPTPEDLVQAILRFVAKQWPGVAPKSITPTKFIAAARKDEQFLKEIERLLGSPGAFPDRYQISRALGRRR